MAQRTCEEVAATTRFGDIRHLPTTPSTNAWLREQAALGAPEGLVAVADHQSAGRGRLGRSWEAPPGAGLLVSVLLRPATWTGPAALPPARWHLLTAATALAGREACARLAGVTPELKWPNDLLLDGDKLAGVLAESAGGAVVVGLGLNLTWAPPGAARLPPPPGTDPGTWRDGLLGALLVGLEGRLGRWSEVAAEHRAACATVGRRVRVSLAGGDLVGVAAGVDDDGRLLVDPDGGAPRVAVAAGDVTHLRLA